MATASSSWKPINPLPVLRVASRFLKSPNAALRFATKKTLSSPFGKKTVGRALSHPFYHKSMKMLRTPLAKTINVSANVVGAIWSAKDVFDFVKKKRERERGGTN